jgi:hypothetical protein
MEGPKVKMGFVDFTLLEKLDHNHTALLMYSASLSRLSYWSGRAHAKDKRVERFIDDEGFGRVVFTYPEWMSMYGIGSRSTVNQYIQFIAKKGFWYVDKMKSYKGNDMNAFYPIIHGNNFDFMSWAFRVHKPYGEWIEKSSIQYTHTVENILDHINGGEELDTNLFLPPSTKPKDPNNPYDF